MTVNRMNFGWSKGEQSVPWVAAVFGAFLAWWMILQAHGTINPDGLIYIEAARLFSNGHWSQGVKTHAWPLYSILLTLTQKVSGLGFQSSAHVLSIIGFALACSGLTILVRAVGGDSRTMLAGMLLMLASPYMVDTVLPMVVRDQLFWGAHIWSVIFFFQFYRERTILSAFAWGVTGLVAVLLRIEALIYLLFLPLALLADINTPWRRRWVDMGKANWMFLLMIMAVIGAFIFFPSQSRYLIFSHDHSPIFVAEQVYGQLMQGIAAKSMVYSEQVMGGYLKEYALPGIFLTLGFAVLSKAISSAGWIQIGIILAGRVFKNYASKPLWGHVFSWLIFLSLVNAVFIILANFLLPKRYLMPIAFVILVYAAFGLAAVYEQSREHRLNNKWLFPTVVFAIAIQLLVIIWPADSGRMPSIQAAQWISSHVPKDSRIYYDSRRIRYYVTGDSSMRGQDDWAVVQEHFSSDVIRQFDYMVVRISKRNPERQEYLTQKAGMAPVATFDNGRGDRVLIYRVGR